MCLRDFFDFFNIFFCLGLPRHVMVSLDEDEKFALAVLCAISLSVLSGLALCCCCGGGSSSKGGGARAGGGSGSGTAAGAAASFER